MNLDLKIFPYDTVEVETPFGGMVSSLSSHKRKSASSVPPSPQFSAVSTAHGRIKSMVFHCPNTKAQTNRFRLYWLIRELMYKMPQVENFIVIAAQYSTKFSEDELEELKTIAKGNNAQLHYCNIISSLSLIHI